MVKVKAAGLLERRVTHEGGHGADFREAIRISALRPQCRDVDNVAESFDSFVAVGLVTYGQPLREVERPAWHECQAPQRMRPTTPRRMFTNSHLE